MYQRMVLLSEEMEMLDQELAFQLGECWPVQQMEVGVENNLTIMRHVPSTSAYRNQFLGGVPVV